MKTTDLRKADLLTGLVLVLFGVGVLIVALGQGWSLPMVEQSGWFTAPGVIPAAAAVVLLIQGSVLVVHALRNGGRWQSGDMARVKAAFTSAQAKRGAWVAVLLLVYVFGLIGRMPFWASTFVFLTVSMLVFRAAVWWKIVLISALFTAALILGFEVLAGIPLP